MKGICLHSVDIISSLGADAARGRVAGCERLIQEIAGFWDFDSLVPDDLCAQIEASLKEQEVWENTVEMGGIQ